MLAINCMQKLWSFQNRLTCLTARNICDSLSDSEKWIRAAAYYSDPEVNKKKITLSGSLSAFEDDEGNPLMPTGLLTYSQPLKSLKQRSRIPRNTHFVDFKRVHFKAGNGGDGCISFLHLFNNPMAGPDGGDGGNGGHIILVANKEVKSLANIQSVYTGNKGEHGTSNDMIGSSGDHIVIEVPVGTLVKSENGELLVDLDTDGGKYIAARGGAGGKGNHFFLSNENRHPRVAQLGAKGEEKVLNIELKTMAHAGLIGFPNVGKSSLLRAISRARPKVANYPFTTLNPYVGIIEYDDYTQISVADLPGLIKDAHKNRGLGISFLKHVERCVCLMYVIDISLKDSWKQLEDLKYELEQFKKGLSKRPHAIVANKYDDETAEGNLNELRKYILNNTPEGDVPLPVIPTSAKYGNNIKELLTHLRALYDLYNRPEPEEEGFSW